MNKQQLAQKRNYFKYVLTGLVKPIDYNCLTEEEKISWNAIINLKTSLLSNFDNISRQLGLKVTEHRCWWCGKPAKLQVYYDKEFIWVCNKHKEL